MLVDELRNEKRSLIKSCLEPVSKVLLCTLAIFLILLNPLYLFIPYLPFLVVGMLGWNESYKYISRGTFLILTLYTLSVQTKNIYYMIKLEIQMAALEEINTSLIKQFKPPYEFLILTMMAVFCRYSNLRPEMQPPDREQEQPILDEEENKNGQCWLCLQRSKKFMASMLK